MNPRVSNVEYEPPHRLLLTFSNKEVKEFDFGDYLNYPVYQVLKDDAFCRKAKAYNGTVVWDESTDFDPDTLYLESKTVVLS